MGFDEDFDLPAVFLFLFLPPVQDFDGLAVVFVCEWGAPSAATKGTKVRSADLLGQLGEGEKGGAAGFVVADEFEGGAEDASGMSEKGGADGGEAAGLFGEIGGEIDSVFERAEFEAVDRELVGEGEDLRKSELCAAHRRKAGEEGARVTWRGHRHRG